MERSLFYTILMTAILLYSRWGHFNTLRPRQNGRHFADDIFICIVLTENVWISISFSLKFVPKVQINNIPALVQLMAWPRSGNKPLSEPIMLTLLTHICVSRPQWVKCPCIIHDRYYWPPTKWNKGRYWGRLIDIMKRYIIFMPQCWHKLFYVMKTLINDLCSVSVARWKNEFSYFHFRIHI